MKRYAVTLIEIMIVILLIGMITGALAFNMSGSMDKGRAFKTEQNIARIKDVLMMEYASGDQELKEVVEQWQDIIRRSPLVLHEGKELLKDGWKKDFTVSFKNNEIAVHSDKLNEYKTKHETTPKPKKK